MVDVYRVYTCNAVSLNRKDWMDEGMVQPGNGPQLL